MSDEQYGPLFQRHSETSRAAALSAMPNAATRRAKVLAFIAGRDEYGATDDEIISYFGALGWPENGTRPRRVELASKGLVGDSGRTRLTRTGRRAVVWVAVFSRTRDGSPPDTEVVS